MTHKKWRDAEQPIFIFQKWCYQFLRKKYPKENESNKLAPSGPQVMSKAMARPESKLQAIEIYSHALASASYFISALIRTSSTLFSTTSVSNRIGTTLPIFIVGLGPKHFLRVITPTITQTTNCTVAYAGHCSQCS